MYRDKLSIGSSFCFCKARYVQIQAYCNYFIWRVASNCLEGFCEYLPPLLIGFFLHVHVWSVASGILERTSSPSACIILYV